MFSFDVVSLFTRDRFDEALQVTQNLLTFDMTLKDRSTIPPEEISKLVSLELHLLVQEQPL